MYARKLSHQEQVRLEEIQGVAFVFPVDREAKRKEVEEEPGEDEGVDAWGCFADDETMAAGLYNHAFSMRYDGHTVAVGGVGGVASLPEHRRGGGIRLLMKAMLEEDYQRGRLFSVLYPFSHSYYRQFGYELCHEGRGFLFPTEALSRFKQTAQARMHREGEGSAPFERVYSRFAAGYNYAFVRDEIAWKRMLRGSHTKAEAYRYILSRAGEDVAYCMLRPNKDTPDKWAATLTDYAYVDREALHDLLGFLYKLAAQMPYVHIEAPDGFEPSALLDEPYDVRQHGVTRSMARVLDVPRALSLMRHPDGAGSYTIAVDDAFLPQNTGAYRVVYGADGVRVSKGADAACDLMMSVTTLAQVCLGFLSLDMALLRSDVRCAGNLEALRRVFVKKPGFLTDRF